MAWNIPGGSSGKDGRNPWQRKGGGGGFDKLLDPLRGVFGGGGGGIGRWVGIVVALWLAFNCFVLITEQQRGVVLRFGQFARVMQPGPHFKLPWPVERVIKVNATQSQAFNDTVPVLTSDGNMVSVEVNVQYRVDDPKLYLFGTRDAKAMLEQAALSTVRELVGRSKLDTVLNARGELTGAVTQRLQQSLNVYRTGLIVSGLTLQNARVPEQVKDAFDEAQRADADRKTAINQAEAYAAKIVPEARGEAAQLRTSAEGYKTTSIARATGDAQRFSLLLEQYQGAPEVTRKRLWLETLQQVLSENRKVVGGDGRQLIYVPMQGGRAPAPATPPLLSPELISPAVNATNNDVRPERSPRPSGREEGTR
ncbi:FtsH protease activity modulator HflK [Lysobacter sp. CFH 32150]|uniref:FtsH protease activity modulator HflK n=1 Tax=Lysobacter sp. CFH 32150 TaxID=2927128 RepID=UPI001FA7F7E5|nr:FtsH protease activity modulator HflK [Lysobacter sp. CFH 32150]MCI4568846.1 FtsH protease activity modulator HflK [Lysobacter sp. CFH 32150]